MPASTRAAAWPRASGFFGVLALALACISLNGLVSFFVTQRTHEFGVRIALGAEASNVIWLVVKEACTLVLTGSLIGLALSFGARRLLETQLFGLAATDPVTLALSVAMMWSIAALAAYIPARRASHVDPMVALRYE